ncbi:protein YIPF [Chloropicon roscoffensis]|uniref:Protein YIPF n=1 Tax=Chloropicon roscoffensis TaxID=1461544 RepID=A0AAX4P006_9CHLO
MNGQPNWSDYGQQPPQGAAGQGNLNFVSTSFDPGRAQAQPSYNTNYNNNTATTSFDDEPPLLEELGIDITSIFKKTGAVFSFGSTADGTYDSDLSGPIVFILGLGFSHMLSGKVLFGLIIGWTIITSLGMSWLVNLLVGPGGDIGMYACCSILGYCLVPQIVLSLAYLVIGKSVALSVIAVFAILWSTRVASRFVTVRLKAKHIPVEEQRSLLAYPWLLVFSMFALLSLY